MYVIFCVTSYQFYNNIRIFARHISTKLRELNSTQLLSSGHYHAILHMFETYKEWCFATNQEPACRQSFTEVLRECNIAIHSPRKDQCDVCCSYNLGLIHQDEYSEHIQKKNEAHQAKIHAKSLGNEHTLVVTMDAQSVLLSPKLRASAVYYKQKLQLHNFTIYSLNNKDVTLYVWHEGNGHVGSNEFASCIHDYIQRHLHQYNHFIFINDGCNYQNRNKLLASVLSDMARIYNLTIQQLFLEKGHTQMEADSVHSSLEFYFQPPIYAPSDYISRMRFARPHNPYNVQVLDYTFFKNFERDTNFTSIRPGKRIGEPSVVDIRALQYTATGVKYKLRHPDQYRDLPQRRQTARLPKSLDLQPLYAIPVAISKDKYQSLQDLKPVIEKQYWAFYDSLDHL